MGIENASRVMHILGSVKPKNPEEQEFHNRTVVGILEAGFNNRQRLSFALPAMIKNTVSSNICTDVYCAQMLEALMLANYSDSHQILGNLFNHVREALRHSSESWVLPPAAIVGVLNVSTWARNNSATTDINVEYEMAMYPVVGKLMAYYFRNAPEDAPTPSKQIIGQFNDALVTHTSEPVIARENMTAMLKPFRGNRNDFSRVTYEMASKFTHRAMSVLAFGLQMDALIEAYEFRDSTPERRATYPSQVM